jgi:predicted RNA-binding protein with PUA-like domain
MTARLVGRLKAPCPMTKRAKEPAPAAGQGPAGHWLVKQEPDSYSWADFAREGRAAWEGVRNYQARNNLSLMKPGDAVLFYASGEARSVVGVAKVSRAAYPDPTADEPGWVAVELEPGRPLPRPVTLARIKAEPSLRDILLVRNSRLSVMPLSRDAFLRIVAMGA